MAEPFTMPAGAGLGTAPMGGDGWELDWGRSDDAESVAAIRAAVGAGAGWIDTAPFYGWGHAERLVGAALDGLAGQPVLLTKCGTARGPDGLGREDHSPEVIRGDVAASLRRLRRTSLDVLQLHDPHPGVPIEETWQVICDLVDGGAARAAGLSNHPVALMDRAMAVGQVAVVQHQFSLLHRTPETDGVLAWCAERGIAFLAWAPLASGFLADGFDLARLGSGDLRRRLPWADPGVLDLARLRGELGEIAAQAGLRMSALAAGWVLARGAQPIIGARTVAEAEQIAGFSAVPADVADAVQAAADAAFAAAR